MAIPTHITVTAPPGRLTPIHPNDGTDPGGHPTKAVAGVVKRVRFSQTIRRAIARGDLIPCDLDAGAVSGPSAAAAPDDLEAALAARASRLGGGK